MGDMVWMGVENLIPTGKNRVVLKVLQSFRMLGTAHSTQSHIPRDMNLSF